MLKQIGHDFKAEKSIDVLTSPFTAFILALLSLLFSIIGITQYKNDLLFTIIFSLPLIALVLSTFVIYKMNADIKRIRSDQNRAFRFIIDDNFKGLLATHKNCLNNLRNSYINFCGKINFDDEVPPDEQVREEAYRIFYKEIKKASDQIFLATVGSLKNIIEYDINTVNGKKCLVTVCIKQLNRCYIKNGRHVPDDLYTFAVFRDRDSYDKGREIGRPCIVNKYSTYCACIRADNTREAYYIENNVIQAMNDGRYKCENRAEVLANRTYTATMVVPIAQNINSEKCFYGFLCIDTVTEEARIFNKEELHAVMQCYSDLLAVYYHSVNMYFPLVFDYAYSSYKVKNEKVV